jgi:hypothetical protein
MLLLWSSQEHRNKLQSIVEYAYHNAHVSEQFLTDSIKHVSRQPMYLFRLSIGAALFILALSLIGLVESAQSHRLELRFLPSFCH